MSGPLPPEPPRDDRDATGEVTEASDGVDDLVERAVVDDAIRLRRERRAVRDRARELATWDGTVRDLAERAVVVTLGTAAGTQHQGTLAVVAGDHVVLAGTDGSATAVRRRDLVSLRADPASAVASHVADGRRRAPAEGRFVDLVDRWRELAVPCLVVLRSGDTERGTVSTVGEDLVTLRTSAAAAHIPLDAVTAVTIRGRS